MNPHRLHKDIVPFVECQVISTHNAYRLTLLPPEEQIKYIEEAKTMSAKEFKELMFRKAYSND
jgi:hypothetical protein